MSDEHEHEHHAFAFQFGPSPEDVERARMAGEASGHETREFFDSLSAQQLRKLSSLFNHAANTEGNAAIYYVGLISAFLDLKFKECVACGKDHDKPFEEMETSLLEPSKEESEDPELYVPRKDTATYDKLMGMYNLEQDDDGSDKVMCRGCGQWYQNLKDRMRRKPGVDGCPGCIQKQKWG